MLLSWQGLHKKGGKVRTAAYVGAGAFCRVLFKDKSSNMLVNDEESLEIWKHFFPPSGIDHIDQGFLLWCEAQYWVSQWWGCDGFTGQVCPVTAVRFFGLILLTEDQRLGLGIKV